LLSIFSAIFWIALISFQTVFLPKEKTF
jgi:hypothetical protein